ncbi:hypothetical protein [Jutongia sp.]
MLARSGELFADTPRCTQCGRILPDVYEEDDICPNCKEANLFAEVKDFIRENDVRELDVAEHFDIPIAKVRKWIREGRIQYKGEAGQTISSIYCQICGKPIEFGTLCPECHRLQGLKIVAQQYAEQKSEMRFINKGKKF